MAVSRQAAVDPVPGVAKPDPILVADGIRRRFGGINAVDVAHLEVQRSEITALIGPNGAGKSTLFNLLSGFDRPDAGTWSFDGQSIGGWRAHRIARAGMVRTFQLTKALAKMSVLENMMLAAPRQRGESIAQGLFPRRWVSQEVAIEDQAEELLKRFKLIEHRDAYAGSLSGGQRKLLEMARALMANPDMILLDEPMAGVNPVLVESLLDHIRGLREVGVTVMFVEHNMDVVMGISDWVVCMGVGKVIAEGPPSVVGANPAVIDAYLGTTHDDPEYEREQADGDE